MTETPRYAIRCVSDPKQYALARMNDEPKDRRDRWMRKVLKDPSILTEWEIGPCGPLAEWDSREDANAMMQRFFADFPNDTFALPWDWEVVRIHSHDIDRKENP